MSEPESGAPPLSAGETPWVVLKFGGTSVSSADVWKTIAAQVRARLDDGLRPLVVHSALSGVSDRLESLVHAAAAGRHEDMLDEIVARHRRLMEEAGLDAPELLEEDLAELRRLVSGVSLLREATPRAHARVLAVGELLATRIGAAILRNAELPVEWVDARTLLVSSLPPGDDPGTARRYLSASCESRFDPSVRERLDSLEGAVLTQGFIARNPAGETVLLGRGGSDTSAAYLAVAVGASRLEIWTDVPGMFTADPRVVPTARLLRTLSYAEAQEIATTGSKVLHPRCIPAVRKHRIPIHIRSTMAPALEGTVIAPASDEAEPGLKAISRKAGVVLVEMETLGMWQEVGFLARAFERFRARGLSIDLVSTSETSVTVSLDVQANTLDRATLEGLVRDLSGFCTVRVLEPCAAISLVGRHIRSLLPKLGPALEVFEEERVHLVAQASSDLNLTFVVDEDQADRVVKKLHQAFLSGAVAGSVTGPTWEEVRAGGPKAPAAVRARPWWMEKRGVLLELMEGRESAYVYDLSQIEATTRSLTRLEPVDRVLYAMKANAHPEVLEKVRAAGAGFECVSPGELDRVTSVVPDLGPDEILFTPNFAPRTEYEDAFSRGVRVTVDGLHPLEHWPDVFRDREIFLRVDPGLGRGHHEKVRTAGPGAKFGLAPDRLEELRSRAQGVGCRIVGLHAHSGSGILTPRHWHETADFLAGLAESLPDVRVLDVGGGLGVPDRPGAPELDLEELERGLRALRGSLSGRDLWLEPGRYLVAGAGVLLARVTQVKRKGSRLFVGVATGMNSLIRPALYGAHHEIVNLTRPAEAAEEVATVVGPICETGDRFGVDRLLPRSEEGDVLLIDQAGAYGRVMSSEYNLRPPAEELTV